MKKPHLLLAAAMALPLGTHAQDNEEAPAPAPILREEISNAQQRSESVVRETANPEATPLENSPDATEVRDTTKLANPDATEVKDATAAMANPDARPASENADTKPVTDSAPTANPDANPVQSNPDSEPLKDTREMANPASEPLNDSSDQANTEAAPATVEPEKAPMVTESATEPETEPETAPVEPETAPVSAETKTTTDDQPVAAGEGEARPDMNAQTNTESAKKQPTTQATAEQPQARPEEARPVPTEATAEVLADNATTNRAAAAEQAKQIKSDDDAGTLIKSILGGAAAGAIAAKIATSNKNRVPQADQYYRRGQRLPLNEVGRTQRDRDQSVDYFVRRFNGEADLREAPHYHEQRGHRSRPPVYYQGNRRVVRYASRDEIPPVLIGYDRLQRVELAPVSQFGYAPQGRERVEINEAPVAYRNDNAYAVSYKVDPNSAVSRDDILFRQGETAFADAYSYDLVIDLAEAMRSSALQNERFVIEGHASAEGDYSQNLRLSQDRAERIARDLVNYGVNPDRLIPVGYGEAEATYPSDAAESLRRLDRRVMVFRLEE
ncbi:MAG: OmpA family protein [Verrucomicrobiales bacterium]|nr:OmpA family protein [Verrucomicrobiales bacterium]